MKFQVDHWINLIPIIKPVHYGIASYVLTTLNTLKEARELPELFMKSKEEMVIWRMLRRVSDRIKLDLDDKDLDQATQVREYRIKYILVKMNKANREIVFVRDGAEQVVSVEEL